MSLWTNLPYEILILIFSHLDHLTDFAQTQLTCSAWYRASQECFYQTITIQEGQISIAEKLIPRLKASRQSQFVKTLNLETFFLTEFTHRQGTVSIFENLIKLCPNLEVLSAQHDVRFPFYQTLERNRDNLRFLQKIPQPTDHQNTKHYINTALAFQKSLRHLYICNLKTGSPIIQQLDKFSSLTNLEIMTSTLKSVFELENIVNRCSPSLSTLIYTVTTSDCTDILPHRDYNRRIDLLSQCPHLKSLIGKNIYMTDVSLNYIMHKFPYLQNLSIKLFNPNYYASTDQPQFELSASALPKLFRYISIMNSFDLFGRIPLQKIFMYLQSFHDHSLNKRGHHFSSSIFLKIEYSNDMVHINYPYFRIVKNTIPYLERHSDIRPFVNRNTSIVELGYLLEFCSTKLPHTDIIYRLGAKFKGLQLSVRATQDYYTHNGDDNVSNFHITALNGLNDILSHCRELKYLLLYDMYFLRNKVKFHTINNSIEELYIEASAILPETINQLSACLPSLKRITFSSCDILDPKVTSIKEKAIILINMPYSHFDSIIWKKALTRMDDISQFRCYIWVVRNNKVHYYFKGDISTLRNSTVEEFCQEGEESNNNSSPTYKFKIKCGSVRSLVIHVNNRYNVSYDLNKVFSNNKYQIRKD